MIARVLIVEDEWLVAADMEATINDLGYATIGIAADCASAFSLAEQKPDIAFVDVNLRDGPTGPQIGEQLSRAGVSVIFLTANPRMLGQGVPGTLGVINKPSDEHGLSDALAYATSCRSGQKATPPRCMAAF